MRNVRYIPLDCNSNDNDFLNSNQSENVDSGRIFTAIKRTFDFWVSLIALIILSPLMLLIAICVKIDDPSGKIIYRQERLGMNGVEFILYKFRSMKTDAEKHGARWAAENDVRVTRVGVFLRRTRLDELPQLLNIIKGNMSFVGPRPERDCFYKEFSKTIPNFYSRLAVKPGLTGLAQVNGGYNMLPEEKLEYDLRYIKTMSVYNDFKCLIATAIVVITGYGAR